MGCGVSRRCLSAYSPEGTPAGMGELKAGVNRLCVQRGLVTRLFNDALEIVSWMIQFGFLARVILFVA